MQFLLRECSFNPPVRKLLADYDVRQHSQVSNFLQSINSRISSEKLDTVTRTLTQVLAGIQLLALDQTEAAAKLTLAEGKKLVTAYLSATLFEEQ